MASLWTDILISQPIDGASVWIRRLYDEVPVIAVYDATAQRFTTTGGLLIPAYLVSRWRLP